MVVWMFSEAGLDDFGLMPSLVGLEVGYFLIFYSY